MIDDVVSPFYLADVRERIAKGEHIPARKPKEVSLINKRRFIGMCSQYGARMFGTLLAEFIYGMESDLCHADAGDICLFLVQDYDFKRFVTLYCNTNLESEFKAFPGFKDLMLNHICNDRKDMSTRGCRMLSGNCFYFDMWTKEIGNLSGYIKEFYMANPNSDRRIFIISSPLIMEYQFSKLKQWFRKETSLDNQVEEPDDRVLKIDDFLNSNVDQCWKDVALSFHPFLKEGILLLDYQKMSDLQEDCRSIEVKEASVDESFEHYLYKDEVPVHKWIRRMSGPKLRWIENLIEINMMATKGLTRFGIYVTHEEERLLCEIARNPDVDHTKDHWIAIKSMIPEYGSCWGLTFATERDAYIWLSDDSCCYEDRVGWARHPTITYHPDAFRMITYVFPNEAQ